MQVKLLSIALALTIALAGCTSSDTDDDTVPADHEHPDMVAADHDHADMMDADHMHADMVATMHPHDDAVLEAVPMVTHIAFGVFEMDVFIEKIPGSGQIYRPTPDDAASPLYKDAPLFAAAQAVEHDPTFVNAGPFPKGGALGVTLSQWLASSGSAAYACVDDTAWITGHWSGLVPSGVYTVWNAVLAFADGAITGGTDLPAGPADGSANTFTADASGAGTFAVSWDGCPEASTFDGTNGDSWVVAIAYHSDGSTYGASPGSFGSLTHVQLFGMAKEGAA